MDDTAIPKVARPFALKVSLVFCLVTSSLLGGSLYLQYRATGKIFNAEMQSRVLGHGKTAARYFDEEAQGMIAALREQLLAELDSDALPDINKAEFAIAIDDSVTANIHRDPQFLYLVQLLRQIKAASVPGRIVTGERDQRFAGDVDPPIRFTYLMTPIPASPDFQILMTVADSDFETMDFDFSGFIDAEEEGNPAGSLYRVADDTLSLPFRTGSAHIASTLYTDMWGTFVTAGIPIVDARNAVVAVLGIDVDVGGPVGRLNELRRVSILVVALGIFVALGVSLWMARQVTSPVRRSMKAALDVASGEFDTAIRTRRRDEFGVLAWAFNQMVDKQRKLTEGLKSANAEVASLNEKLEDENSRLGAELAVARAMQQLILPAKSELASISDLDIAGYMAPADEVGGDYYDVLVHRDGAVKIGVGDVCGHGLESGMVMIMTQAGVRMAMIAGIDDPKALYADVNRLIFRNLERMNSHRNLTLVLLDYFPGGAVTVTGQHEDIIILRAHGDTEIIDTCDLGIPVGLDEDVIQMTDTFSLHLEVGDTIVLFSDGVTEAESEAGELYGMGRFVESLEADRQLDSQPLVDGAVAKLREFIGSRDVLDDIAMVAIRRTG